jgi:hypothetical protein
MLKLKSELDVGEGAKKIPKIYHSKTGILLDFRKIIAIEMTIIRYTQ